MLSILIGVVLGVVIALLKVYFFHRKKGWWRYGMDSAYGVLAGIILGLVVGCNLTKETYQTEIAFDIECVKNMDENYLIYYKENGLVSSVGVHHTSVDIKPTEGKSRLIVVSTLPTTALINLFVVDYNMSSVRYIVEAPLEPTQGNCLLGWRYE